jgi:tripartite-type tricarboxylate transporter receptor subunit TctC
MSEVKENPIIISYKGASQVLTDISGGHIDLTYLPITVLKPHIDSGNLVPILSTHTISDWPQVPTIKSIHNSWKEVEFGHVLLAPQGIDPVAVKYWTTFIEEYVNDQEVKKEFEQTYAFTLPLGQKVAEETITNIKPKLDQILKIERERVQNK